MLDEIYRKRIQYPIWKKKALFSYVSFHKSQNIKYKTNGFFFIKKLDELFRYFFKQMFPLNPNQLILNQTTGDYTKISDLFFNYDYILNQNELNAINNFKSKFNHPDHPFRIISYIFNIVIMVFGKMMNDIMKQEVQIIMLCANTQIENTDKKKINFIIVIREGEFNFLKTYFRTLIYQFAERLPALPAEFMERLRVQKDKIYQMALDEYPNSKNNIESVLFTLEMKCQCLFECTPLLDVINFICSRVEDSIFHIQSLVKDIVETDIIKNQPTLSNLIEIFDFTNNFASLFSTFQSNNRANVDNQFQLFFFYSQYFCAGGPETMQLNPNIIFPDISSLHF
jgi:hypothetical protein